MNYVNYIQNFYSAIGWEARANFDALVTFGLDVRLDFIKENWEEALSNSKNDFQYILELRAKL